MSSSLNFGDAFNRMLAGDRMTASFMPEDTFVAIRKPDDGSMNTDLYMIMVAVAEGKGDSGEDLVRSCVPWTPGSRSLFSTEWKPSTFNGRRIIAKNGVDV